MPDNNHQNKMALRTQEINELLGQAPNYLVRWGTIWLLVIVLLFFVLSAVLRYPDTLNANISLRLPARMPADSSLVATAAFPVYASGKLKPGQPVIIGLNNYPQQEYGVLEGRIESIEPYPDHDICMARVRIPRLVTNRGIRLPTTILGLNGYGYAVVGDRSVLRRFFTH